MAWLECVPPGAAHEFLNPATNRHQPAQAYTVEPKVLTIKSITHSRHPPLSPNPGYTITKSTPDRKLFWEDAVWDARVTSDHIITAFQSNNIL